MSDAMHRHTPSLLVNDSRGLPIRAVSHYRSTQDERSQARPERQQYDAAARPVAKWDARLFRQLATEPLTRPNLSTVFSLTGAPLAVDSVDAGGQVSLYGEAGHLLEHWDARGTHWTTYYDELHRPSAVSEQPRGQASRTSERFSYADSSELAAANNVCGRLTRTCDGAGSNLIDACSISGQILRQTRRFLRTNDLPNWPESSLYQQALLESGPGFSSNAYFNVVGEVLAQTDASDNRHTCTYDVSGQLKTVRLKPMSGSDHLLVHELMYDAHGRIESQTAGNGVISRARFDPSDGRLHELVTERPGTKPLQYLLYGYDPAGNVTRIEDKAQPVRHFSGQRIDAVNEYEYDSLYQLIRASGRETASAGIRPELPELARLPVDKSQLLNYTQRYIYDEAGNLLKLSHEGTQAYTRHMLVDTQSNRALPWSEGDAPPDFDKKFDANGNQQVLVAGRALYWDSRNRLIKADAVTRSDQPNDGEHYAYDAGGKRLRKTSFAMARTVQHIRDVRYLPGLEIRTDSATGEHLEVITLQAGRTNVRYLHWVQGKPDAINNDQLRYSVDDHLGSSTLELDADAKLISHEGYYPFGGTAWWAARSAVEACYKVIRYSGVERDSTGLYYYGVRYYAPWLMRWISADPLGNVDGLNLYRMVRNNPISRVDSQGGISVDFEDMETLAAGGVIGVIITGLTLWAVQTYSAWTKQNAKKKAYSDFFHQVDNAFNLGDDEIEELDVFMTSINAMPSDIAFRHDSTTNALNAFYLTSQKQKDYFRTHQQSPLFMSLPATKALFQSEIRGPVYPEDEYKQSRRASTISNVSNLTSISQGWEDGEVTERRVIHKINKQRRSSNSTSSTVAAPTRPASINHTQRPHKNRVDIGNFFQSKSFKDAQRNYPQDADDLEEIVEKAIYNYVNFNSGHPHFVGDEISLGLPGLAGATGKGKIRLLLLRDDRDKGLWRPHRIGNYHRR
ncbi:insecticidal toxin complex protein TccC [Pseudomonas syringae]|uniref:RHS repeat-associated core domain-containing protein n=1 Tax=Pseudomonas syringae TaxID=317 RepID=UPI0008960E8A|nr:RHS repeat-associated core domain-containing protein [Pseudomonas syringae]SDW95688.1 insecticidal toxin complex protein TccC [Pseudomonas syringae]SFM10373.1 insecticidal toxin complex protein TccC [Pseudomonas syringae]